MKFDQIIVGAGPGGAAAAIVAARAGASVAVFDKAPYGRDKVCGDGLTPRAVTALLDLKIDITSAHKIQGLRMIAGKKVRELDWPTTDRFVNYGAVWPRRSLDKALVDAAIEAGAEFFFSSDAMPIVDGEKIEAIQVGDEKFTANSYVVATGAQGPFAKLLGAVRDENEPFALAIRAYGESPKHDSSHLEACLTLKDEAGTSIPGYGWMFPAGDGTVNIGVGALSTMKNFKKLNLNKLLASYRNLVKDDWELGPNLERPKAWRLPMSVKKRHGENWVAIGDAAGLINPMNGEGIDYALESGMLASELLLANPTTAPAKYDVEISDRFDQFLRTGRRFSFLIGHPMILKPGLKLAVGTDAIAKITLGVMGNLIDSQSPGAAGKVLKVADKSLALAEPLLRKTRAK